MRIESPGSAAASNVVASPGAVTAASERRSVDTSTAIDPATGQPEPLHYPWITRLSAALEQSAAKEKASPFKPAEIAGETVNRLV